MNELPKPQRALDLDQFMRDICRTAEILHVPCDQGKVQTILEAYRPRFLDSGVALRTTNHPVEQRNLSVRYLNFTLPEDNPYAVALERGLLSPDEHPVFRLYDDVRATFPIIGSGVDATVRSGMQKIWPFLPNLALEDVYKLPSLPESVRQHDDYFKKYGLGVVSLLAIDYWHKTMNVYFNFLPPGPNMPHPKEKIAGMITDLGFELPSEAEMAINQGNVVVYYTFDWESSRCLRASFVIPHVPADKFPVHLDPFFAEIVGQVPTLSEPVLVGLQTAYTWDKRNYLKIEFDYSGTMVQALARALLGG